MVSLEILLVAAALIATLAVAGWAQSARRTRELRTELADLRQQLAVRTRDVLVERETVRTERARADQFSEAKARFLTVVTHELRTPMNGVLGMTDLALSTRLTPEQREYLLAVRSSGETLLALLNDLLDLTKIEANAMELSVRAFNVRDCILDALRPVIIVIRDRQLEFDYYVADDIPELLIGDAMRLRQILINLLGNAAKFTDEGRIDLAVERRSDDDSSLLLLFRVHDSGVGIPYEQQEEIFEPFHQADSSATRRHGGAGLGLSIARQLVALMGGMLWVESDPGEGSTFYFTARLGLAPKAHDSEPEILDILLVEDNLVNQRVAEALLGRQHHRVVVARNGVEAVEAFGAATFDLILMDLLMPEMDGLEATRQIRSIEAATGHLRTRIVAMTASNESGDRERCLEAGMDDFLPKPVDARQLFGMLSQVRVQSRSAGT